MKLKNPDSSRTVTDVGPGDFVKVGNEWKEITFNSAHNATHHQRNWTVRTKDGGEHSMWGINRYAKKEDLE